MGAITGETGIAGAQIGKIEIRGSFSLVEIDSQVVDRVIDKLKRTVGTRSESIRSLRTLPGPTDGIWSTSPTIHSAARDGIARSSALRKSGRPGWDSRYCCNSNAATPAAVGLAIEVPHLTV